MKIHKEALTYALVPLSLVTAAYLSRLFDSYWVYFIWTAIVLAFPIYSLVKPYERKK